MEAYLNAEIYLICITVTAFLLGWTLRYEQNSLQEMWLRVVFSVFLACFSFNLLFVIFAGIVRVPSGPGLSAVFKTLYFICLAAGVYARSAFQESSLRSGLFELRGRGRLMSLFPAAAVALLLFNAWHPVFFEIGPDGIYRVLPGMRILFLGLFLFSLVFCIRYLVHVGKGIDPSGRGDVLMALYFPLCMLAGALLCHLSDRMPVVCVFVLIDLIFLYVGTMNRQISTDKLTQVNNRQNLMGFLDYKIRNHDEGLYLIMIDIDRFKSINDTFGHMEGDTALVRAASVIKNACGPFRKRPYIARYGGDEFIVVIEGTQGEASSLRSNIKYWADKLGSAEKRYRLSFSMGMAECRDGMSARDLIAEADAKLYAAKRDSSLPLR